MDSKAILYIIIFVGYFIFSLLKDSKQVKKKKAASQPKAASPDYTDGEGDAQKVAVSSQVRPAESISDLLERLKAEASKAEAESAQNTATAVRPIQEVKSHPQEKVVRQAEVPHASHEMPHRHSEAKSVNAPKKVKKATKSSSPFLSTEDELFSDTIQEVKLAGFEPISESQIGMDVAKECPLRTAEDAKRAFVYAEIWNRKYC